MTKDGSTVYLDIIFFVSYVYDHTELFSSICEFKSEKVAYVFIISPSVLKFCMKHPTSLHIYGQR